MFSELLCVLYHQTFNILYDNEGAVPGVEVVGVYGTGEELKLGGGGDGVDCSLGESIGIAAGDDMEDQGEGAIFEFNNHSLVDVTGDLLQKVCGLVEGYP